MRSLELFIIGTCAAFGVLGIWMTSKLYRRSSAVAVEGRRPVSTLQIVRSSLLAVIAGAAAGGTWYAVVLVISSQAANEQGLDTGSSAHSLVQNLLFHAWLVLIFVAIVWLFVLSRFPFVFP